MYHVLYECLFSHLVQIQIILLLTFFLTIFTDLVVAVNVGVVLAVLQFMRKMVNTIDVHEASSANYQHRLGMRLQSIQK